MFREGRHVEAPPKPVEGMRFLRERADKLNDLLSEVPDDKGIELSDAFLEKVQPHVEAAFRLLGEERAKQFVYKAFSGEKYRRMQRLDYWLTHFTEEGFEGFESFFGKAKQEEALNDWSFDVFDHSAEEWETLRAAFGESFTPEQVWEIVGNDYMPGEWVLAAEKIQRFRERLSPSEFDALLRNPDGRKVLRQTERGVAYSMGSRRNGDERHVTVETIDGWKEQFGDKDMTWFFSQVTYKFLAEIRLQWVNELSEVVPDFHTRMKQDFTSKSGVDAVYMLLHWQREVIEQTCVNLSASQREALFAHPLEEVVEFFRWIDETRTNKDMWEEVRSTSSEDGVERLFAAEKLPHISLRDLGAVAIDHGRGEIIQEIHRVIPLREEADAFFLEAEEIQSFLADHPAAAPFLRLRYTRLKEEGGKEYANEGIQKWVETMRAEHREHYRSDLLQSVGVEIEIRPDSHSTRDRKTTPYEARDRARYTETMLFGIAKGRDNPWEFAMEPSSLPLQARFISELIAGNWINKDRLGEGNYSFQINVGIPEGVELPKPDVSLMVSALTAAFVNAGRLKRAEFKELFKIKEGPREFEKDEMSQKEVDGKMYGGRFEFRPFDVDEKNVYRLLYDAPLLAAALIAHEQPERSDAQGALGDLWEQFAHEAMEVFEHSPAWKSFQSAWVKTRYGNLDFPSEIQYLPDSAVDEWISALESVRESMVPVIRRTTRLIRTLVRDEGEIHSP